MEHEVATEPGREVQLSEVISHLLTVLDPPAAWYLLTRTSRKSMTLRAQGQAVDGPDDEADPWEPAAGQKWHCMQNQCPPAPNAGPYEPVNSLARPCRPPCGEDCHRGGVQGKPIVWPGN